MQVMISTDMEGISGIVDFSQTRTGAPDYERARRYFTHDVNAAVAGCVDAGATRVVISDPHAFQINYLLEELPPEAEIVQGGRIAHRPSLVMEGLDESFDVVLLVGFHAAAHYPGGIISHSYFLPSNFFEVRLNDQPVGEPEIGAALAGSFNVPCGLVTGDDVTVQEVGKVLPDIESVITKYAVDRTAARLLPLSRTGPAIREGAKRACDRAAAGDFTPYRLDPPITLEVTCANYGMANKLAAVPQAERVSNRVVGFRSESFTAVYEALLTFCYVALSSQDPGGG
jgi:D-amino peptidase